MTNNEDKSETAQINPTTESNLTKEITKKLYQFHINDNIKNKNEYHFKDNKVDTTKYNCITFLPKSLLYQFMRLANVYFLICAIIQCIPEISPLGPATAIVPLVIVLSVSLIREGYEDCKRARLDKEQNSEPAEVYRNGIWEQCKSGDLEIGELVEVKNDGTFPADLILIDSIFEDGSCFIETGSLDGEKTLKMKNSPKQTANKFNLNNKKVSNIIINGKTICDHPNPELYQLNGKIHIEFEIKDKNGEIERYDIPLDAKQLLLKGAKLRNTDWIIGIVCYTGHNCKIMKNAKEPRVKYSSVESLMNMALVIILIVQSILCIICAILRGVYYNANLKKIPLKLTTYSFGLEGFLSYFTYLLLLNTMIPISLIITLEVVKLIQGTFMGWDCEGYSLVRKRAINPNSVSLNEELGLVNYIFSDKTGTLTCNKMQFKYCVIGNVCYEFLRGAKEDNDEKNIEFRKKENIIPFNMYEMYEASIDKQPKLAISKFPNFKVCSSQDSGTSLSLENSTTIINEFWQALALCHDCSIQKKDDGTEDYLAMSPDSIELVKSARFQGFGLTDSGNSNIRRINLNNGEGTKDFELLQLIEFSSDRKRESVIVKDGNLIKLYIKGADSIIKERLSEKTNKEILEQCSNYVNKFSDQGFRTLFVGMKILTKSEYDKFSNDLNQANMELEDKDKKVNDVIATIEKDVYLIGATIVEDKLQDSVPETIRDLRIAGIKIWMLTGDKMNTAYNIGLSCNLISKSMKTFMINGVEVQKDRHTLKDMNKEEREKVILEFAKEFEKFKGENISMTQKSPFGILVDEKALLTINEDKQIQNIFLKIAKDAVAVICCRVSPLQKSQVVKMMKKFDSKGITLAIGDGGNDVSMIMEAHIGIGIYGEEGMRAVQSSDYAIGEFKILHRLLLFHGRTDYIRNSECIQYFFYKNFVFTLVQFAFGFYNNFSGQTIIDDWYITLFNLLFTSLPLGARACLDYDVWPTDGKIIKKMMPFLYSETRNYPIFNMKKFILTLLKGTVHCLINYFFVIFIVQESSLDKKGNEGGLWFISVNLFTNILIIVSIDLLVYTRYNTYLNALIMLLITFISYIIFIIIVHNFTMFNSCGTMLVAFRSVTIWIDMLFICGTCFIIDLGIMAFNFFYFPSLKTTLQVLVKNKGPINEEDNSLPSEVIQNLNVYKQYENINENIINDETERRDSNDIESRKSHDKLRLVDKVYE